MSPCHLPIIILVAGGYSDECRNVVEDIRQKKKKTRTNIYVTTVVKYTLKEKYNVY